MDQRFRRGVELLTEGDNGNALDVFTERASAWSDKRRAAALYNMAICHLRLGSVERALLAVSEAASVDPAVATEMRSDADLSPLVPHRWFELALAGNQRVVPPLAHLSDVKTGWEVPNDSPVSVKSKVDDFACIVIVIVTGIGASAGGFLLGTGCFVVSVAIWCLLQTAWNAFKMRRYPTAAEILRRNMAAVDEFSCLSPPEPSRVRESAETETSAPTPGQADAGGP